MSVYKRPRRHVEQGQAVLPEEQRTSGADPTGPGHVRGGQQVSKSAPGVFPFVGRRRELAHISTRLSAAVRGQGGIVLLAGEPGTGKTRLAEQAASAAGRMGLAVAWGRSYDMEGSPAFWPWRQAVRSLAEGENVRSILSQGGLAADLVAMAVPELAGGARRRTVRQLPLLTGLTEGSRFPLFDSLGLLLRGLARRRPALLVLEDIHWADRASLLLLEFLAPQLRDVAIVILAIYRDTDLTPHHPLTHTLASIARHPGNERIQLRGLGLEESLEFVAGVAGTAAPHDFGQVLHRVTEGNPFFMTEILRLAQSEPGRQQSEAWRLRIPQTITEAITDRFRRLSETCLSTLRLAAVFGNEFSSAAVERAGGGEGEALLEVLAEAEAARVIISGEQPGLFRFAHVLMRDTLYNQVRVSARARLHRSAGEALEAVSVLDPETRLPELAHHFFQALPAGAAAKAVQYARRAGENALARFAYEEAAAHYAMALRAAQEMAGPSNEAEVCALLLGLGEAQQRAGEGEAAKKTFLRAAELARGLMARSGGERGVRELALAALGYGTVTIGVGETDPVLIALLEEALSAVDVDDSILRARLVSRLGWALYFSEHRERAESLARDAVIIARDSGSPETLALTLYLGHLTLWGPENSEERLAMSAEIIRLGQETRNQELELLGRHARIADQLELGNLTDVDRELARHRSLAGELRQPFHQWNAAMWVAMGALLEGRLDEAERLIAEALRVGREAGSPNALMYYGAQMFVLRREQGRLAEMLPTVQSIVAGFPALPVWRCALASIFADLAQEEDVRREFELLAADGFNSLPRDALWLPALSLLSDVCAYLGDGKRAAALYHLLLPFATRNIVVGNSIVVFGPASHYLGRLAAVRGQRQEAGRHFENAMAMAERLNARSALARSQYCYAELLADSPDAGDRERARELASAALAAASDLGIESLRPKVGALLDRLASAREQYPDGLSEREVEVLRLIAAGKSNREIAETLVISLNTVLHHVSNIYNKTGVSNRAEAAVYAARHGLVE